MFPVVAAISAPADMRVGSLLHDPQSISGPWEVNIAPPKMPGKVVGINIEISADASGVAKNIVGTAQHIKQIWITTYVRTDGRSQRDEWSTDQPAQFSWTGNHLELHAERILQSETPIDIDLVFDRRKAEWSGKLRNDWFAGSVTLKRPYAEQIGYYIIGDWAWGTPSNGEYRCEHVTLGAESALVIWTDNISLWGYTAYVPPMTPPPTTPEWYGQLDMDAELKNTGGAMMFFTGNNMGGDVIFGNISSDHDTFSGKLAHFGNGLYPTNADLLTPFSWKRTTPDCRV